MPDIIRHDPEPSLVEVGRADAVAAIHDTADERAYIECPCEFRVSGHDESENRRAYEGHDCEHHDAVEDDGDHPRAWHESLARLLSLLGFFAAVVLIVLYAPPAENSPGWFGRAAVAAKGPNHPGVTNSKEA